MKKAGILGFVLFFLVSGLFAQNVNLSFANPSAANGRFCADVYMSFTDPGKLGSCNLMFNFDPAVVGNPILSSDNISDPPFYLVPNVSQPTTGRASINIELAVTGFGDNIAGSPDSTLIGNICLDILDSTQTINLDWFVSGTIGTVVYLDDEATILTPGTLKGISYSLCPGEGTACDDGNAATINDMYDANCNCVGTPCPPAGTACDDGNANTTNDVEDGFCNCAGTPLPPPPPAAAATTFNLSFGNASHTATNLCADIFMSFDGAGKLGSANLMFDFNTAQVNNAVYISDNISDPPFYIVPTVTSPSAGRASFNIELAVTGFGDSVAVAPDSLLIGRICLDLLDTTQTINWDWFVSGTVGTVVYLDDETTILTAGTLSPLVYDFACPPAGTVCDDGDSTTTNDVYDANCVCVGTPCPPVNTVCDDGDSTTFNDLEDGMCNCVGTPCPVAGTTCDDGNPNTINDVEDGMCNCAGTPLPPPPPAAAATTYNLSFGNASHTATNLCADIFMSFDGAGKLGSANLMFDFNAAQVNNAVYISDNISDPPFYIVPTVTSPAAGRASYNIELAVTGFGDSVAVAPDSLLIGRICLDLLDTTQTINWDWFVSGTVGTVVYLDDETTLLTAGTLSPLVYDFACPPAGTVCDDGDSTTTNDVYDANCVCVGTPCPPVNTVCDDGDSTTFNDLEDGMCNCVGTPCPVAGTTCDDGNPNTINDVEDGMCNCAGTPLPPPPPPAAATTYNLSFGNASHTATNLCADIFMSFDGAGKLGSANLMFDFNTAQVNNAVYISDNISDPPFYIVPTVTSPSAGRASFNIELAVTGFGDSVATAPDSLLIGRICLDLLDTTQTINWDWFVSGTVGTVVYLDDETTILSAGTLSPLVYDFACPPQGTPCDDGDATTGNDMYDANCVCVGTPCPVAGTACDDGNANTINDVEDGMCNCAGTPLPPPPPGTPATEFNLSFGNASHTATTLCADIFMSYNGDGKLGSANLMFDFNTAQVNNAVYISDNISDPPFYITPTVTSPSAGRASFNIELAVTGFGDSVAVAPDSLLIGRVCLDLLDTTQTINWDWFVSGTVGTVVYLDDETTILTAGTLRPLVYDFSCPPQGTPCDDGDATTGNDMYDANCVCVGTPCPVAGTACDDGNANTINDVEDGMCNCAGTPLPPPPPGTPATEFNLSFGNASHTATTLCADIFMSYNGNGRLGSANLMFDFNTAQVNNAVYISDNISDPPIYITPTVTSPSAGRASFNIELAVTGFGDSVAVAPDSLLIGRVCLDLLDTTQTINWDWFVSGTVGTVVYLDDEATILTAGTLKPLVYDFSCPPQGTPCDDGDATTGNDMYDANCVCVGTPCPVAGTACDDGNANTINDVEDGMCNCAGTPLPPPPPGTPATEFNLSFGNASHTATTLCADIFMSYNGVGKLGSANLMFDFNTAQVNNAVYVSDNISDPPFYITPTVTSPSAGRASFNIELAVTGFGDSVAVAPDSLLIGRVCLDLLDTTQTINWDWFVSGTVGTVVYLDDEATILTAGTLKPLVYDFSCPPQGTPCDDGDSTTGNDMYDANCVCVGTPCPPAGTTCDDGNANTINDVEDGMCNCAGTPLPPPPPGTPATEFNLCFANPTLTATNLCADIYMSYNGVGKLGSSNLMFDFDPAVLANAVYISDNISDPPFYITPTVTSPSTGRGSFNIELAVTGFGDSVAVAPDSLLIGSICLDRLDTTQAVLVDWFVSGTVGTVVYLDDESTILNAGTLKGLNLAANCPPVGSPCDDGDSTTTMDAYDAMCNCIGVPCPPAGTTCDDGDSTTFNDLYDGLCNCVGTPCPVAGTTCDDGNPMTINDVEDGMCNCAGTPVAVPPATQFDLCFGNPTSDGNTFCVDIFMAYDGPGKLGSSNLMFDFDPDVLANPMYSSDNISDPPVYLLPTVTTPAGGRASYNIELAVPGLGDSVAAAPDSLLIGSVCLDIVDNNRPFRLEWYESGSAGTVVYLDDEASQLIPRTLKDITYPCMPEGTTCDDGDSTTTNDMYDANCNCIGTPCPPMGTTCDDGDSTTINDMEDGFCNCVGEPCPPLGTACDDGDSTTVNDMYDGNCNCIGAVCPPAGTTCDDGDSTTINDVEDGLCNCAGEPCPAAGTVCDDGDSTTFNDMFDANCNCVGEACPPAGTACDDGDPMTTDDVEDGMCNCAGEIPMPNAPDLWLEGMIVGDDVLLEWTISSENDMLEYILERSVDSIIFEEINTQASLGDTPDPRTYSHLDTGLVETKYYYRVKAIGEDNSQQFSNVVVIEFEKVDGELLGFNVYPIPLRQDDILHVEFVVSQPVEVTITLVNGAAQRVLEKTVVLEVGRNDIELDIKGLAEGLYFLGAQSANWVEAERVYILDN